MFFAHAKGNVGAMLKSRPIRSYDVIMAKRSASVAVVNSSSELCLRMRIFSSSKFPFVLIVSLWVADGKVKWGNFGKTSETVAYFPQ